MAYTSAPGIKDEEVKFYAAVPDSSVEDDEFYDIKGIGVSADTCVEHTLSLIQPHDVHELFAVIEIPPNIFYRAKVRGGRGLIPNIRW